MRPNGSLSALVAGAQSISTRRLILFLGGILVLSTTLLLFTSVNLSTESLRTVSLEIPDSIKGKLHVPTVFKPATHTPPPPAKNSTASTEGWFASWSWMNPFSSGQGDRIALPPIERCSIYTYYEPPEDKVQAVVEDKMLLAWRRVWWAYGFKPMILGPAEAKTSGFYEMVNRAPYVPAMKKELMRLLAWNYVDAGILVNYRVLPMGPHDDDTISSLRRCKFVYMNRYKNFDQKLYSSDKVSLNKVLMYVTENPPAADQNVTSVEEVIANLPKPEEWMREGSYPAALADYTPEVVADKYKDLEPAQLPGLVNAHLHSTFLSHYPDGMLLLSPFPDKFGALHHPALELANRIASCPVNNPLPESCPPNLRKCTPCKKPAAISSPDHLEETTKSFTLGTIPHPFTTIELANDDVSLMNDPEKTLLRYIRRKSVRDPWIKEVTKSPYMKSGLGSPPRASKIKELVVPKLGSKFLSIWSTDKEGFKDTEWTLGFVPPTLKELKLQLPGAQGNQKKKLYNAKMANVRGKNKIIGFVEGWNTGDTEVWKFVNAWRERRVLERSKWTAAEKKYGQGLDKEER